MTVSEKSNLITDSVETSNEEVPVKYAIAAMKNSLGKMLIDRIIDGTGQAHVTVDVIKDTPEHDGSRVVVTMNIAIENTQAFERPLVNKLYHFKDGSSAHFCAKCIKDGSDVESVESSTGYCAGCGYCPGCGKNEASLILRDDGMCLSCRENRIYGHC